MTALQAFMSCLILTAVATSILVGSGENTAGFWTMVIGGLVACAAFIGVIVCNRTKKT